MPKRPNGNDEAPPTVSGSRGWGWVSPITRQAHAHFGNPPSRPPRLWWWLPVSTASVAARRVNYVGGLGDGAPPSLRPKRPPRLPRPQLPNLTSCHGLFEKGHRISPLGEPWAEERNLCRACRFNPVKFPTRPKCQISTGGPKLNPGALACVELMVKLVR